MGWDINPLAFLLLAIASYAPYVIAGVLLVMLVKDVLHKRVSRRTWILLVGSVVLLGLAKAMETTI